MFYSQIILAKKGPLSQLWLAAHFQDKKLTRPQIFATDIASSVDSITNPQVPLALRVSGHLLLGVVRIYSKKVHFLWQDCHQAMVQIQMAFVQQQPNDRGGTSIDMDRGAGREKTIMSGRRRRTRDTSNDEEMDEREVANLLVPTATLQGFGIPFDLNDDSMENAQDWVPAELDNEDDEEGQAAVLGLSSASPDRRNLAREAADLTLNETLLETTLLTQPQEEEQWTAFDPTDGDDAMPMPDDEDDAMPMPDDDDDAPANAADTSSLQAEAPRANESVTSDVGPGRPSVLGDAQSALDGRPRMSEAEFSLPQDVSGIPQMDDDDGAPAAGRASSLALDQSSIGRDDDGSTAAVSLGDGSLDGKKRKSSTSSAEPQPKKRKARRKRRIIRANDGNIELSSKEIRQSLKDTSSIVKRPVPYGTEEPQNEDAEMAMGLLDSRKSAELYQHLSYEELFQRPGLADDGQCAPELINLWKTMAKIRDTAPREEEEGNVEQARDAAEEEDGSTILPADGDKVSAQQQGANEVEDDMPMPDDDDQGMPMPDDDEEAPMPMPDDEEDGMMMVDDDDEAGDGKPSFSLGLEVNEWDDEEEEDTRQEAGDELVSSTAKWHKNTIKLYNLLKVRFEGENKMPHALFKDMVAGSDRKEAVIAYFELLQLKTWDYIEVEQSKPFGDIVVSRGPKFTDGVPN